MKNKDGYDPLDWPHRTAGPEFQKMKDKRVAEVLQTLRELAEMTRPNGGDITAKHKDRNAFAALACAGELVELLAGWAIDHAVGSGLNRLQWVPRQVQGEKAKSEYLVAKAKVDDHRHERSGGAHSRMSLKGQVEFDPIVLRQILINLLVRNPGGFPHQFQKMIVEALEALNYGETLPLLRPLNDGRKAKLLELKLQLEGVQFVEYWHAMGVSKLDTRKKVGGAYGVSDTTVRLWKARLIKELGQIHVSGQIQFAKNAGARAKETGRKIAAGLYKGATTVDLYSDEDLQRTATTYKQLIRQKKA